MFFPVEKFFFWPKNMIPVVKAFFLVRKNVARREISLLVQKCVHPLSFFKKKWGKFFSGPLKTKKKHCFWHDNLGFEDFENLKDCGFDG